MRGRGRKLGLVGAAAEKPEGPPPVPFRRAGAASPAGSQATGTQSSDVPVPLGGGTALSSNAGRTLDLILKRVDQELERSERAGNRARQAFAISVGFFAIVQTVAFGSFAYGLISPAERAEIIDRAVVAGYAVAVCGLLFLIADGAFRSHNVDEDKLLETHNAAENEGRSVEDDYIELYSTALETQRVANKRRFIVVWLTQLAALASVCAVVWELVYSLQARGSL